MLKITLLCIALSASWFAVGFIACSFWASNKIEEAREDGYDTAVKNLSKYRKIDLEG